MKMRFERESKKGLGEVQAISRSSSACVARVGHCVPGRCGVNSASPRAVRNATMFELIAVMCRASA